MRGIILKLATIFMAAGAWACAGIGPPIQLHGTPGDLKPLVGSWWGEYFGDRDHLRSGSIAFKLVEGDDHAHGDVLMTPAGWNRPYQRYEDDQMGTVAHDLAQASRVLSIRFVSAIDGTIEGVLDSYWDPDRRTQATSTFRGRLLEDTIEGTFTTRYANGAMSTGGRWRVTRER